MGAEAVPSCGIRGCRFHYWENKRVPFNQMVDYVFEHMFGEWDIDSLIEPWRLHEKL